MSFRVYLINHNPQPIRPTALTCNRSSAIINSILLQNIPKDIMSLKMQSEEGINKTISNQEEPPNKFIRQTLN